MGVGRDIGASMQVGMREMAVAGDVGAPGMRGLDTDAGLRRLGVSALRIFLSCSHYPTILSPGSPSSPQEADLLASRAPIHQKQEMNACSIEAVIQRCLLL